MNKNLSEKGIKVGACKTAKYTVIIRTLNIWPGSYYIFDLSDNASNDAYLSVDIFFVETSNRSVDIAKVTMKRVPGDAMWSDESKVCVRISEAYAKCGKELAKLILKKGLK